MKAGRIAFFAMIVFALVVLPLVPYVVGYLTLCERVNWSARAVGYTEEVPQDLVSIERNYSQQWLMTAYKPAGRVEQLLRGMEVQITWHDPDFQFIKDAISIELLLTTKEDQP